MSTTRAYRPIILSPGRPAGVGARPTSIGMIGIRRPVSTEAGIAAIRPQIDIA